MGTSTSWDRRGALRNSASYKMSRKETKTKKKKKKSREFLEIIFIMRSYCGIRRRLNMHIHPEGLPVEPMSMKG